MVFFWNFSMVLNFCSYYTYSNMEKIIVRMLSQKDTGHASSCDDEDHNLHNFSSVYCMASNVYDVLINLPTFSQEDCTGVWSFSAGSVVGATNLRGKCLVKFLSTTRIRRSNARESVKLGLLS
uniref:Uncharacterized protein n=1 Tax=Physcomitrium patens TaxID=3218 RepID=A0A7I4FM85_PHYPA